MQPDNKGGQTMVAKQMPNVPITRYKHKKQRRPTKEKANWEYLCVLSIYNYIK